MTGEEGWSEAHACSALADGEGNSTGLRFTEGKGSRLSAASTLVISAEKRPKEESSL